jgi:aromatic ring-opening dioxygenase LigB subunit
MSVSLAAIVPYSPLLLNSVNKNSAEQLPNTLKAYDQLNQKMRNNKIDTVILLSPVGIIQEQAFTFNVLPKFTCQFEDFGDFATKFTVAGDVQLAQQIKTKLDANPPIQLTSANPLDYGSCVPLSWFKQALPKIKVLPLYAPHAKLKELFAFGQKLKPELELSPKKIAVVASANLSQRLSKASPAGYSRQARAWDKTIVKALGDSDNETILKQSEAERKEVAELGLEQIALLLGILADFKKTGQLLSYEAPWGVGLLTYIFAL